MLSPSTLWAFARPHTMLGTALAATSLTNTVGLHPLAAANALPAALCANAYVTGLNQIVDRHVDFINKPDLPLPSGALSIDQARRVVCASAAVALAASVHSKALGATVVGSMALGTLYSVEPFRWKRSPLLAALSIVAVRGVIVNVGFCSHALGRVCVPLGPVCFFSAFAIVIAILKDAPDVVGDSLYELPSFAIWFGRRNVCVASASILATMLAATAIVVRPAALSFGAIAMAAELVRRTARFRDTREYTATLYQFYWKCFYACYIALPFCIAP